MFDGGSAILLIFSIANVDVENRKGLACTSPNIPHFARPYFGAHDFNNEETLRCLHRMILGLAGVYGD